MLITGRPIVLSFNNQPINANLHVRKMAFGVFLVRLLRGFQRIGFLFGGLFARFQLPGLCLHLLAVGRRGRGTGLACVRGGRIVTRAKTDARRVDARYSIYKNTFANSRNEGLKLHPQCKK